MSVLGTTSAAGMLTSSPAKGAAGIQVNPGTAEAIKGNDGRAWLGQSRLVEILKHDRDVELPVVEQLPRPPVRKVPEAQALKALNTFGRFFCPRVLVDMPTMPSACSVQGRQACELCCTVARHRPGSAATPSGPPRSRMSSKTMPAAASHGGGAGGRAQEPPRGQGLPDAARVQHARSAWIQGIVAGDLSFPPSHCLGHHCGALLCGICGYCTTGVAPWLMISP